MSNYPVVLEPNLSELPGVSREVTPIFYQSGVVVIGLLVFNLGPLCWYDHGLRNIDDTIVARSFWQSHGGRTFLCTTL